MKENKVCKYTGQASHALSKFGTPVCKEYFNLIKCDKSSKYKFWLSWEALFNKGLQLERGKELLKTRYLQSIRLYFNTVELQEDDFVTHLSNNDFTQETAAYLYKLASGDLEAFFEFVKEFYRIISNKNHTIDYFLTRGWSLEESKLKLKDFFLAGSKATKEKREKDWQYDKWFKSTRMPGNEAVMANLRKNGSKQKSKFEVELGNAFQKLKLTNQPFFSPIKDPILKGIEHKNNFIHDFFINDTLIVEYNGSYYHKDYLYKEKFTVDEYKYEFRKAYNCLELVERKKDLKYGILWEKDIKTVNEAVDTVKTWLADTSGKKFFSSRDVDCSYYNEEARKIKNEFRFHQLFKDIAERFSQESHCLSKQVAALAVKNGRIIGTGINGTVAGDVNCDEYFKWWHSTHNIETTFEEWIKTSEWRELHHNWSNSNELHAEMQLICNAAKEGGALEGCDIYSTLQPCYECTKNLSIVKPRAIFYVHEYDKFNKKDVLNMLKFQNIIYSKI